MRRTDPSRAQDPATSAKREIQYRIRLEKYFASSSGSNVEKLQNFAKFVPRQTMARFLAKYELFKMILDVQGSIVECGVYLGGGLMTFAQLSAIFEPVNTQRKIIGFDTFTGLRGLSKEDHAGRSIHSKKGGMASRAYSDLKTCIKLFDANRPVGHVPKVFLVKGDIRSTLPEYLKENPHTVVSLLYLDLDVFSPTLAVMDHLLPRMPKGAVIAFDELNSEAWPGETQAVMKNPGLGNLRIRRFPFDSYLSYATIE